MPLPRSATQVSRRANRAMAHLAVRAPGFGIVVHQGRRSGRTYRTPVNVFRRPGGYAIALTYGRGDWVHNVLHAGQAEIVMRGEPHRVVNPRLVSDAQHAGLPLIVRGMLTALRADEQLLLDDAPPPATA